MSDELDSKPIDWAAELAASKRWLSRVVYARVGDAHAVDDVMQELGAAFGRWPKFLNGEKPASRWLYAAAVKQSLNYCRSRKRRRETLAEYARHVEARPLQSLEPMQALLASENVAWVRIALKKIPARQRDILLLKYYELWSCAQIAEKLGIAEATVRRHLVNARKRLRAELVRLRNDAK